MKVLLQIAALEYLNTLKMLAYSCLSILQPFKMWIVKLMQLKIVKKWFVYNCLVDSPLIIFQGNINRYFWTFSVNLKSKWPVNIPSITSWLILCFRKSLRTMMRKINHQVSLLSWSDKNCVYIFRHKTLRCKIN